MVRMIDQNQTITGLSQRRDRSRGSSRLLHWDRIISSDVMRQVIVHNITGLREGLQYWLMSYRFNPIRLRSLTIEAAIRSER